MHQNPACTCCCRMGTFSKVIDTSPYNGPSLGKLQRKDFAEKSLAREQLFIQGAWRDHLQFALRSAHGLTIHR